MKNFVSKSQKIGEIGENIACRFLREQGFAIIERNYTKKCGEIDIVARKGDTLHFVEVKTVSYETYIKPEENLHPLKLKRLWRTIGLYLLEKAVSHETKWQIDAVLIRLDIHSKKANVKLMDNIVVS